MKKLAMMIVTACMLLSVGTAAYAAAPTETKHEKKMHEKKMHAESKKMHMKKHSGKHGMKAKGTGHAHKLHAKSMKAKATEMPKTGFGGASEQME